jgi:hypothetical protein
MATDRTKLNLKFVRGEDFVRTLTVRNNATPPVAVSQVGSTFTGGVYAKQTDTTPVVDFTFDIAGASSGIIVMEMSDIVFTDLKVNKDYYYSVFKNTGTLNKRIMHGTVKVGYKNG